jgi:hypothetical protein
VSTEPPIDGRVAAISKGFGCLRLLIVIGLTCSSARADRVGDFVNGYLKKKQIPGCAVPVRKDGEVVLSAGYGIANLEHDVKVTPKTVFQSGSVGNRGGGPPGNNLAWSETVSHAAFGDTFFEEDSDRTVRFIRARGGRVTAAIISVPEELTLRRLP